MEPSVRVTSNFKVTSGYDLSHAVQTKAAADDVFVKPPLDEVICEDRALLLSRLQQSTEACQLDIHLFPRYKIEAITIVCTVPKIEVFLGPLMEYTETVYGEAIPDEEDFVSYRYDIEVQKSGIVDITLKLLTPSEEICIYGIVMLVAPNPNGITTLLPQTINLENVQQMLNNSNQKISPNAEKCKTYMQAYNKYAGAKAAAFLPDTRSLITTAELPTTHFEQITLNPSGAGNECYNLMTLEANLKCYIDKRLTELEQKITKRLDEQTTTLDKILKALDK